MPRSSEVLEGRSRKGFDHSGPVPPIPLGHGSPTSFRMAREEDLEIKPRVKNTALSEDSTYGVQSLGDSIHEAPLPQIKDTNGENNDGEGDPYGGRRRSTLKPFPRPQTRDHSRDRCEAAIANTADSSPSRSTQEGPLSPSMSRSLTSLSLDSQAPLSSLPGTPKSTSNRSFPPSDEDSMRDEGSQAVPSSEDDEAEFHASIQDSAPQLIMPSIKMPSRRPFTDQGKSMGRLKVLIAGDSGVGKTSLIKSIIQTCEAIVHVDPLSPNLPSVDKLSSGKQKGKQDSLHVRATQQISEVYASTKPYPSWWSDIEDTKVLRRRKSIGDTVLERNLCFVDTPGYSKGMSIMEGIQSVLQYIESQLTKPFSAQTASEGDIAGLLSGSGGSQVDVVFYLVTQTLRDEDVIFLQHLAAITNVIPLIAKADIRSPEETEILRRSIDTLQRSEIKFFTSKSDHSPQAYSVCSATADDDETMDASTLMSPEYIQPLIPSQLSALVKEVFNPDTMACLRHLAAKKLVQAQGSKIFSIPDPFSRSASIPLYDRATGSPTSPASSPHASQTMVSYARIISPYARAKLSDHTQQEERLAQIRLAKWAGDLQRSLQNERARYEAIARGERAVWLTERLGETVNEGALVPREGLVPAAPTEKETMPTQSDVGRLAGRRGLLNAGDPLGLLRWNEAFKRRGWIAFQVLGSVGIFVWLTKTWIVGSGTYGSWTWGWFGEHV